MDDDNFALCLAKTRIRDAFNAEDIEGVLAEHDPGLVLMGEGESAFFPPDVQDMVRIRLRQYFAKYRIRISPIIGNLQILGAFAWQWGWYRLEITPRAGGEPRELKLRYCETWVKSSGQWKAVFVMLGQEHKPKMLDELQEYVA